MRNEAVATSGEGAEPPELVAVLYTDGIIACRGAFSREWAAAMHEDIMTAFAEAVAREGGAVGRGPAALLRRDPSRALRELSTWPPIPGSRPSLRRSWDRTTRSSRSG